MSSARSIFRLLLAMSFAMAIAQEEEVPLEGRQDGDLDLESLKAAPGYEVFPDSKWSQFKIYDKEADWTQAVYLCQKDGPSAHLATIDGEGEAQAAKALIKRANKGSAWVGANDFWKKGVFYSIEGGPIVRTCFHNFAPGEPNNKGDSEHCLEINSSGLLNDASCTKKSAYICEMPTGLSQ